MKSYYTKEAINRFVNPKNFGKIKNADGVGKVGNIRCGDLMEIHIKIDKDETIKKGEELLIKELRKSNKTFAEFFTEQNINVLLDELSLDNLDEIYRVVGSSKYTATSILNMIYKVNKTKEEIILDKLSSNVTKAFNNKNDVLVEGIDEIKITLANCCGPIKGDDILGYITKGKGITVHRVECHNVSDLGERIIDVSWNADVTKKWPTSIIIETEKKDNFLLDLLSKTANTNVTIQSINTISDSELIKYNIVVLVEDISKLNKFITDISQMQHVHKVERIIK